MRKSTLNVYQYVKKEKVVTPSMVKEYVEEITTNKEGYKELQRLKTDDLVEKAGHGIYKLKH